MDEIEEVDEEEEMSMCFPEKSESRNSLTNLHFTPKKILEA